MTLHFIMHINIKGAFIFKNNSAGTKGTCARQWSGIFWFSVWALWGIVRLYNKLSHIIFINQEYS